MTIKLRPLLLMLPALVPSWRFFDAVAPSPRIHYRLVRHDSTTDWQEFNPRPQYVSAPTMLKRMLWNPQWNETLFITSCAERLLEHYTWHSEREILWRIRRTLTTQHRQYTHLQFRLMLVMRQSTDLQSESSFVSQLLPLAMDA